MEQRFSRFAKIAGVNDELGLVFGWAIVSKSAGEDVIDSQDEWIPDEAIVKAGAKFMGSSRVSGDMHARSEDGGVVADGDVVFAFPLTEQVAKALGIETEQYGLIVGARPSADVFAKVKSGEYTGFSIGGIRLSEPEEVEA